MTTPSSAEPVLDSSETRQSRRAERRAHREGAPGWILGAILIIVGLVLMAQNFGMDTLDNWWALFILIPAAGALGNAWRAYKASGRLSEAAGSFLVGAFLLLLAVYFLFGFSINWALVGPLFLILGGGMLLVATLRQ